MCHCIQCEGSTEPELDPSNWAKLLVESLVEYAQQEASMDKSLWRSHKAVVLQREHTQGLLLQYIAELEEGIRGYETGTTTVT